MSINRIHIEFVAGTDIRQAIETALEIADKYCCIVTFRFNGVDMEVRSEDSVEHLLRMYEKGLKTDIWVYRECKRKLEEKE